MSDRITLALKSVAFCLGFLLFAAPAQATFVGTTANFTFIEPDPPNADFVDQKPGVLVLNSGIELFARDGSAIGGDGTPANPGVMTNAGPGDANGEYIDIGMVDADTGFIEFRLFGGFDPAEAGGLTTGFGPGAKYQIDFDSNVLALFEAPTLDLTDVFGVAIGTELMLNSASQLMLFVDTLGVDETDNFGLVRLDFELKDMVPNPIPIPAALPLMLTALAGIGFLARRRKPV